MNSNNKYCEFSSVGINNIICDKDAQFCGMYRFCNTVHKPVMLQNYEKCRWRNEMLKSKDKDYKKEETIVLEKEEIASKIEETIVESKKEKIEIKEPKEPKEEKQVKNTKKIKTKSCKILFIAKGKAMVEMFGHNFRVKNTENKKAGDTIEIKYIGTLGQDDFSIIND